MRNKKNNVVLIILSICVLLGAIYKGYVGTGIRADIFLFYDYPGEGRLMSNIVKDLSDMTTLLAVFILWIYTIPYKETRKILMPFAIVCALDIIDYILFFKQYSIVKLFVLLVLLLAAIKNIKKQQ